MLPDLYTTIGWPQISGATYSIDTWNGEVAVNVVPSQSGTTYTHAASQEYPVLVLVYPVISGHRTRPFSFPVNDPASISTIRWRVRVAINDAPISTGIDVAYPELPKWTDREIDGYIREAIGLFNNYSKQDVILETRMSMIRPEVLARFDSISKVAYYNGYEWIYIPQFERRSVRGPSQYWSFVEGQLRLFGTYPEDPMLEIHGDAPYPIPMNDINELTVHPNSWDILSMYAQGRCYLRLAGQSAQLDRWKEDGKRNDNPLTPVARLLIDTALGQMKDRKDIRSVRRYRA